ncbi:hypothetical protein U0070_011408 [Myodes glareolus]|uniref:Uncharacterized protein n=1 Tax=Myodes glareolus TaxID=447135 RepID=A0AAW0HYE2_MYOGA
MVAFFQDGLKAVESLKPSIETLSTDLHTIKQAQDEERRQLIQLRDILKSALQVEQKESMVFLKKIVGFGHIRRMRWKTPSLVYTPAVILQGLLVPAEPFLGRATPECLLHDAALLEITTAW